MTLLLFLAACRQDYKLTETEDPPLSLTMTSPAYGAYVGSEPVLVAGTVSPAHAQVIVNGTTVPVGADGTFSTSLPFAAGMRAMQIDIQAIDPDETLRQVIPVFDSVDPRLHDPGAMNGLLTPSGLDALEPVVAELVDVQALLDQVLAGIPSIDTDYIDILPTAITTAGTTVDLAPAEDAVAMYLQVTEVTLWTDLTVLDSFTIELGIVIGEIGLGVQATPAVDDAGMVTLELHDAAADIDEFGLVVEGYEMPGWLLDLLVDPLAGLIADLGAVLVDVALDTLGAVDLGGPFAFDVDLLGTPLSVRLADVGAGLEGVGVGILAGVGDVPETLPELPPLGATTPAGDPYQLGLAVHEGLLNTLFDTALAGLLDLDLELSGEYGELLGSGIKALPGGNQMPAETSGYCIGFHAGEAQVARFVPGTEGPLLQVWMPDVRVTFDTVVGAVCQPWLEASVFVRLDLTLDGTTLSSDLEVPGAVVLAYGAEGVDDAEVAAALGTTVSGLFALFASQLSFDLGDLGGLGLPIELNPRILAVEPLDDTGRYGLYMDAF